MDDLDKYINKRKGQSPSFERDYDKGYEQFKIGVLLKKSHLEAVLTQDHLEKTCRCSEFTIH